ncbi:GtrA family protein [Sphingobacterium sp. Mn56C]|uniref:GtrA family protein n=1 Tax=Sphingobacterium sp. Mn56C TaxID=3395261 RepID=UPI003BD59447
MYKLKQLFAKIFSYSIVRFICVGGIATVINYVIYLTLVSATFNPNIAYLLAFSVSIVCNYFLSSYFTFQVKPSVKRALQFLAGHLINLCNELILLNIFLHVGVNKFFAPIFVVLIAFPLNFIIVRYALKGNPVETVLRWFKSLKSG